MVSWHCWVLNILYSLRIAADTMDSYFLASLQRNTNQTKQYLSLQSNRNLYFCSVKMEKNVKLEEWCRKYKRSPFNGQFLSSENEHEHFSLCQRQIYRRKKVCHLNRKARVRQQQRQTHSWMINRSIEDRLQNREICCFARQPIVHLPL